MDRTTETGFPKCRRTFRPYDHCQHSNEDTHLSDDESLTQTLLRENILSPTFNANPYPQMRMDETPSAPVSFTSDGLHELPAPLSYQESSPSEVSNYTFSPPFEASISLSPVHPFARIYNPASSNLCQASKASAESKAGVQVDGDDTNLGTGAVQGTKSSRTQQDRLPPHWLPITAETDGIKKAKSNYTRRRWDRIVKSRQKAKGKRAPCQDELVGMIEQLKDKLGTKAEPLIVVEISTTVQKVGVLSEDEEVKEAGGRLYRCTKVTGEDGKLTNSAAFLLTKYVRTNHNFKEFIHPLDDELVRDAEAKAGNLIEQHPYLCPLALEFQDKVHSFRRDVADASHFNEVLETCHIDTINKLWKELKQQVDPHKSSIVGANLARIVRVTPRRVRVDTSKRMRTEQEPSNFTCWALEMAGQITDESLNSASLRKYTVQKKG